MAKILLISHIFPPAIDGGSRVIYKLSCYFESQKHQTLYLSSDCSSTDDFTKPKYKKISKIYHLRSNIYLSVYHRLRRPLRFLEIVLRHILFINHESYLLNLVKVLQKGPVFKIIPFIKTTVKIIHFNPDLIIAGPLPTTTILYADFFKKLINLQRPKNHSCKLLINASFHPDDPDFHRQPLIKTLQSADYLWTLTKFETNYFIKKFRINPKKIILAGNGIDESFLKKPKKSKIYHLRPNILFIGSLAAHKGIDTLINSFSKIYHLRSNVSLTIAGQKTLHYPQIKKQINKLPKTVKNKIKFVFSFPQSELKNLIDNCHILVLPSKQESFGLVLLEAWARSKPVVVNNIAPLAEITHQTQGGLIFNLNNSDDLAQKIKLLIDSPKLRHQLGQNGFNYVKNNYTWLKIGQKISEKIF